MSQVCFNGCQPKFSALLISDAYRGKLNYELTNNIEIFPLNAVVYQDKFLAPSQAVADLCRELGPDASQPERQNYFFETLKAIFRRECSKASDPMIRWKPVQSEYIGDRPKLMEGSRIDFIAHANGSYSLSFIKPAKSGC